MVNPKDKSIVAGESGGGGGGGGGVSLGKGAWDCDTNTPIPPEKEALVFEEVATMDYPFEGIPTVPPRKDMDHFAFFCGGCRYRVSGQPDWTVAKVGVLCWHLDYEPALCVCQSAGTWDEVAILYPTSTTTRCSF